MVEHFASNIQNIIQSELFKAQKSIKIAVSWFTNDLLFQPLLLKQGLGIGVELVLNRDEINCGISNPIVFEDLVKSGGKIYWNTSKELMHDKFCIIDDNIVITGSYNWTNKAEHNKENISVFRGESDTLGFYKEQFQKYVLLYGKVQKDKDVSSETGNAYGCNNYVAVCKQYPFNRLNFVLGEFMFHLGANGNLIIVVRKYNDSSRSKSYVSVLDNNTLQPILPFENEHCEIYAGDGIVWLWKNHRAALYSLTERRYITNYMFDEVDSDIKNGYIVHFNNHYGICDATGKFILPCEYDEIGRTKLPGFYWAGLDEGLVRKGGKYGYFEDGKFVLGCMYDELYLDGKPSRIGHNYGLISDGWMWDCCHREKAKRGTIVLDFVYDEIRFYNMRRYLVIFSSGGGREETRIDQCQPDVERKKEKGISFYFLRRNESYFIYFYRTGYLGRLDLNRRAVEYDEDEWKWYVEPCLESEIERLIKEKVVKYED